MVEVVIVKKFALTHDRSTFPDDPSLWGTIEHIAPGVHDFHPEMAEHWFVVAHSDHPVMSPPMAGTPEFAAQEAARIARRKMVETVLEQQAHEAGRTVKEQAMETGQVAQDEEDAHAAAAVLAEEQAKEAAVAEAARTGTKPALPQRRGGPPAA